MAAPSPASCRLRTPRQGISPLRRISSSSTRRERFLSATFTSSPRRAAYRETKPRRNWVKTALVIGGSAGAGAGIGALAGGKKGALVGAAVGGGAASLFEAFKR